jgi:hypothetical protein
VRGFVRNSGLRHPREMSAVEIKSFLYRPADERHVSASTHRLALSAILYFCKELLDTELPWMQQFGRS